MILALLSLWQQPIEISRSTDRRQLGIMLPIGVMIKDPSGGGGGGNADTLNGQVGSYYLDRSNHTGTQAISTVSGLEEALDNLAEADSDLGGQIVAIQNTLPLKADLVGGVVPTAQIPAIAITELLTLAGGVLPASEAQMLTLRGQTGDFTIRTDVSTQYIIVSGDGSLIGNWLAMPQAASPVLSVNGQTGVIVLGRADMGINSSDDIPEGVSNLYWNAQRTRDATLTGFSPTNSAIISTDNVVQAFGKAQGQINALATVATSGSYNDLSDKPSIDMSRTLLYTTPTPNKPINNTAINPIENMSERLFDNNYIFPANSLAVGDYFELECRVYTVRINTTGSVNFSLRPFVNSSVVGTATLNTGASTVGTFTSAVVSFVDVKFKFVVVAVGVSGLLACNGYSLGDSTSVIRMNAPSCASCDTTQPVALNIGFYRIGALIAGEGVYVKSAQLYRLNNPS